MEYGRVSYEGVLTGVSEQAFRKVGRLLKNAFATVSYEFAEDQGRVVVSGPSAMFEQDPDNRMAIFDVLAEHTMEGKGRGEILARRWASDGEVALAIYTFQNGGWTEAPLAPVPAKPKAKKKSPAKAKPKAKAAAKTAPKASKAKAAAKTAPKASKAKAPAKPAAKPAAKASKAKAPAKPAAKPAPQPKAKPAPKAAPKPKAKPAAKPAAKPKAKAKKTT